VPSYLNKDKKRSRLFKYKEKTRMLILRKRKKRARLF
jgi:hypothetical protein